MRAGGFGTAPLDGAAIKDTFNFVGLCLLAIGASLAALEIYRMHPITGWIAAGLIGFAFFCQLIALFL